VTRTLLASLAVAAIGGGLGLAAMVALAPGAAISPGEASDVPVAAASLPATLRETGLYADWGRRIVAADNLPFSPQYPLWSDGATKRRWIYLPPGGTIDATRPDAWQFPVGTRLWKEFAFGAGRRVETRYMERTADGWRFATYAWSDDQREALLAPADGIDGVAVAPGLVHAIPGQLDCRACHDASPPVLGFSALQLSSDRDLGAPHAEAPPPGAVDLPALVRRGLVTGLPDDLVRTPPRISARSPTERAALGYLHGNCGGCHDPAGSLGALGLALGYSVAADRTGPAAAIATTFERPSRFRPPGQRGTALRIAPGRPAKSVLLARMTSHGAIARMPPLGTRVVDHAAAQLIERWITEAAGSAGAANPNP
jgi:hypothetical protein